MRIDTAHWQQRLVEGASAHRLPGASLAILADDRVATLTTGCVNVETGVTTAPDAVFQVGSISKVYVATAIMRLVDEGRLDLDAPVAAVMPEFAVADPRTTAEVTPRHLLSHTSGIAGDFFVDTGRGDDALARFVELCADLGQDVPFGTTMSYSNTGYSILGRLIERITGQVWDDAMRDLVYEPLGLRHTCTLPEDAVRFRTAFGHQRAEDGSLELVEDWDMPRSSGPAGGICATAAELVAFARMHLADGRAPDGSQVLSPQSARQMREPQVSVPDPWTLGDHWGLGWMIRHVDGRLIIGHDGNGSGQNAFLTVVPDAGVAVGLLTNGGDDTELGPELIGEVLADLCDIAPPPKPRPAPGAAAEERTTGSYERFGVRLDVVAEGDGLRGTLRLTEPLASQMPGFPDRHFELLPSTAGEGVYVARLDEDATDWTPVVSFDIDGDRYMHFGARAMRMVVGQRDPA